MKPQIEQRIEQIQQSEQQRAVHECGGEKQNNIAYTEAELAVVQIQMKKYIEELGL